MMWMSSRRLASSVPSGTLAIDRRGPRVSQMEPKIDGQAKMDGQAQAATSRYPWQDPDVCLCVRSVSVMCVLLGIGSVEQWNLPVGARLFQGAFGSLKPKGGGVNVVLGSQAQLTGS